MRVLAERLTGYHICQSKLAEALEKILKADLIANGWFLERTHDLQRLIDALAERDVDTAREAQGLAEALTETYTAERYPGFDLDDPDWPTVAERLSGVSALLDKVRDRIARRGTASSSGDDSGRTTSEAK